MCGAVCFGKRKATLAQSVERLSRKEKVDSSILSSGSFVPLSGAAALSDDGGSAVPFSREWRNGRRAGFRFLCL